MEGDVLKGICSGFSLWEISLGLVLVGLVAGTVVSVSWKMTEYGRGQRTLEDMATILEGCRQYDALHGAWPLSFSALQEVLPQASSENVWGAPFVIVSSAERVWVETMVPVGVVARSLKGAQRVVQPLSGQERIRMFTGRKTGASSRLVYEKRNVYVP